ncbi:MAG: carbamoyltransferase [Flavobacteriales bacterium]|jgi:carbamoyltransferase
MIPGKYLHVHFVDAKYDFLIVIHFKATKNENMFRGNIMSSRKIYLGLASTAHDPAVAIVDSDGKVLFAEAAERHLQDKRAWFSPPASPFRIKQIIDTYAPNTEKIVPAISWDTENLQTLIRDSKNELDFLNQLNLDSSQMVTHTLAWSGINFSHVESFNHHLSHAAAASYSSEFEKAAVAVIDGNGEGSALSFYSFDSGKLELIDNANKSTASLGSMYAYLCSACGWDPLLGEEWKVMGLAPYGKLDKNLYQAMRGAFTIDGLNLHKNGESHDNFFYHYLPTRGRMPDQTALEVADLAYTGQRVFTDIVMDLLNNLQEITGFSDLVLTGGCALNSSCNGEVIGNTKFDRLHVNSAPSDDGNALGAAYLAYLKDGNTILPRAESLTPYLGSSLSKKSLNHLRKFSGIKYSECTSHEKSEKTARLLAEGKIIGWAQGRAEFGPRALGNRSILADPRSNAVKEIINDRVKFREEFRPFAPSILDEYGNDFFEHYQVSRYMERTLRFRESVRSLIPGAVHIDGTGRLQSVRREWNEDYYNLISAFHKLTGIPLLINTSFNVMGKPIIATVEDAAAVFCTSGLDVLVIENTIFEK